MAAPTYSWNEISSSQTDADSPIDVTLMEGIRQNLALLKEWVGSSFTPAVDHDHDGLNSKSVVLADSVVSIAKLKLAQGSFNINGSSNTIYIPIARYSHGPHMTINSAGSATARVECRMNDQSAPGTFREVALVLGQGADTDVTVYWDYHIN